MADDTKVQQYVLLAKGARGRAIVDLISKATSEPGLFGFGELLAVPSVQEIKAGEFAPYFNLLQLFAYGTWAEYKGMAGSLPQLNPQQQHKLKQLSVVSRALKVKVIPYQVLQQELEIPTVRELEDFIITECFYNNIIKGKLDQKQATLQIHNAIGRDVRPEQLAELEAGLHNWIGTAQKLLGTIEERIMFASTAAENVQRKKHDVEAAAEEIKKTLKAEMDLSRADMFMEDEYMDDQDRVVGAHSGPAHHTTGERSERTAAGRPKRRLR